MKLKTLIFFVSLIFLFGCQVTKKTSLQASSAVETSKSVHKTDSSNRVSISEAKSIEYIHTADSASIKALLECNEKGEVQIKEIAELKAGLSVKPKMKLVDNYIYLKCEVDSFRVYQIIKNRFDTISEHNTNKSDASEESEARSDTPKKQM